MMKFEIEFVSVKDRLPTKEELQKNNRTLCIVESPLAKGKSIVSYKVIECIWDYYIKEPAFNISDSIIRAWAFLPSMKEVESCDII